MNSHLLAIAIALIRAWTRLYTWDLPRDVGAARCQEIESDLWECQHDASGPAGARLAARVLMRGIAGAPADLAWRAEQADTAVRRPAVIAAVAVLALVVIAFAMASTRTVTLPALEAPRLGSVPRRLPPPPPPPPPLCRPDDPRRPPDCTPL